MVSYSKRNKFIDKNKGKDIISMLSKPEVIILKESSDAKAYLEKLEKLLLKAQGDTKKQIQKEIAITKAGIIGEDNILFELKHSHMDMVVLHDIYIETKDGLGAQIDFAVVTSKIIFLIECKNLFGDIEIDSKGNFIRTIEYGGKKHKEGIYSPITQNERHMAVLKECKAEEAGVLRRTALRGLFDHFYKPLVVLANPKTVVNDRYAKKEIKEQVIRVDQLIGTIKKMISESRELPSSKKSMMKTAEKILERNIVVRKDYSIRYEALVKRVEQPSEREDIVEAVNTCPRCGANLILRKAKKGPNVGQDFYGCSNFPKCRYTQNTQG